MSSARILVLALAVLVAAATPVMAEDPLNDPLGGIVGDSLVDEVVEKIDCPVNRLQNEPCITPTPPRVDECREWLRERGIDLGGGG